MNSVVRRYMAGALIALASGLIIGCLPEDDFQDLEVMAPSPRVSFPLLNTNLTLSDLITIDENNGYLVENQDKSYSLLYRTKIQSKPASEFFPAITEQNYAKHYSLGLDAPSFLPSSATTTFYDEIPLELNELTLYKIESKQGNINLTLSSTYQHDVHVKVTFPDILDKKGNKLQRTFSLIQWGSNTSTQTIPLADYIIHLNEGKVSYEIEVSISGSGNPISSADEISFNFNMAEVEFSYLEGNFTNISVPIDADTLKIPLLTNTVSGNISLNPILKMNFSNSFGVKILPDLSNIFVKQQSGSVVRLVDEGDSKIFSSNFEMPYLANKNDKVATKLQTVEETNSNIEEAFAEIPREVSYSFGFSMSNAESDTSFILDNSMVGIDMQAELPLEGNFDIILEDTIAVDFTSLSEKLEELKILIKTENSFPINANLQVYFLNEHGEKIKDKQGEPIALFEEGAKFMYAATIVDTNTGETIALHTDMPLAATIYNTKYNLLKDTKNFLVRAEMNSSSEQDNVVKLYSFYNIRFSMAMQLKTSL